MTRLLVLGNSHAGALKQGETQFLSEYTGVEIGYFVASEPAFSSGAVDTNGIYRPVFKKPGAEQTFADLNGSVDIDLNAWDRVLVTGIRAPLHNIANTLGEFDLVECAGRECSALISTGFLEDFIDHEAQTTVEGWRAVVGPSFGGVITMAPMPSEAITTTSNKLDRRARASRILALHPLASRIYTHWTNCLRNAADAAGLCLLLQPQSTIAAPFLSFSDLAVEPAEGSGETIPHTDFVHMNHKYGLAVWQEFASTYLNIKPSAAQA
ncbi:MAG: hypothetical protein WBC68_04205 [Albidovulum sp.]